MMNKPVKIGILVIGLIGLGAAEFAIGPHLSSRYWGLVVGYVAPFLGNVCLLIFGTIFILGSGKDGSRDLSRGCAIGTGLFFLLVIALATLAYSDILTW